MMDRYHWRADGAALAPPGSVLDRNGMAVIERFIAGNPERKSWMPQRNDMQAAVWSGGRHGWGGRFDATAATCRRISPVKLARHPPGAKLSSVQLRPEQPDSAAPAGYFPPPDRPGIVQRWVQRTEGPIRWPRERLKPGVALLTDPDAAPRWVPGSPQPAGT
jgi:hypothetical protein